MTYESFLTLMEEEFKSYLKEDVDSDVSIKKVLKNNGIELDALTVRNKSCKAAPTIYMNSYYDEFTGGRTIEDIVAEICEMIKKNSGKIQFNLDDFMEFDKIKDSIAFKIVNAEANSRLLEMVPHVRMLDFAMVFYCLVHCNEYENATTLIYNQHLDMWNVDLESIKRLATDNTPKLLPAEIKSMSDIIREMLGCEGLSEEGCYNGQTIDDFTDKLMEELTLAPDTPQMYVLTNKYRLNGASSMFYKGVLKDFSMRYGKNLIVLPSSVHEVILIPMEKEMKPEEFDGMVVEVNREEVDPCEILSDHAYVYDCEKDMLLMR